MKGNLGTLEYRPDRDREGFAAVGTLVKAGAGALAFQRPMLPNHATVRADGAVRPDLAL